jgi:hypothetical protein
LVQLVVPDRRGLQVQRVEHVERGLVLQRPGREQRGADVVARREEQGVGFSGGGTELLDGAGELDRVGVDPTVEVIDVDQVDGDGVCCMGGRDGQQRCADQRRRGDDDQAAGQRTHAGTSPSRSVRTHNGSSPRWVCP